MIKAVFIDYMGTVVDGHTPEMGEIIQRICKHSDVRDPKQIHGTRSKKEICSSTRTGTQADAGEESPGGDIL